ncbi:ribose-phosphate pyrophosphokinase 4-like isoform X2 [Wolffia australiana]
MAVTATFGQPLLLSTKKTWKQDHGTATSSIGPRRIVPSNSSSSTLAHGNFLASSSILSLAKKTLKQDHGTARSSIGARRIVPSNSSSSSLASGDFLASSSILSLAKKTWKQDHGTARSSIGARRIVPSSSSPSSLADGDLLARSSILSSSSSPSVAFSSPPKRSRKTVFLFYCEETRALAERVAAESDAIELRSMNWRTFDDGFPNLFIPNAQGIRGQHVAFLASFSSPRVIFEQLSVIYALPRLFISSFTVVLPFFPTGTSERMEEEGDIATAFTLARILSNIPISRGGPTSLVIYDIHALRERFYFGDNVLPFFESGIPLLKNRLQQLPDSDNISIAFPDDGAWKRFNSQLQHFPTIVCTKVREGDRRIVRLKEGDPRGRHVVIVDDLVQSGGTLIECQILHYAHH